MQARPQGNSRVANQGAKMDISENSVNRTADQAHDTVDAAANSMSGTARDLAGKVQPTMDRAKQAAHQTVDRMADAAAPAAQWINDNAEQLMQQQEQLLASTRSYVRDRPLAALGIAIAAGYIVGRIAR